MYNRTINDLCFVFSPGRPADYNRIFGRYRQEEVRFPHMHPLCNTKESRGSFIITSVKVHSLLDVAPILEVAWSDSPVDKNSQFLCVNCWKTNFTMWKYRRIGSIWMVTPQDIIHRFESWNNPIRLHQLSPPQRLPLGIPITVIEKIERARGTMGRGERREISFLFPLPMVPRALSFSFFPVSPQHKD